MATEKQIAANRANARRSCGPKTVAGKLKSSQNAYRHGLSAPLRPDPVISTKANAIAPALAGEQPSEDRLASAAEFGPRPAAVAADPLNTLRDDGKVGSE